MKKVTVLLIMLLIVLTCVTAAMSYSAAVIQSPAVLKVVSANEALLALIPAEELLEIGDFCTIEGGVLNFNFSGGKGLTANSEWIWPHFFTVKNNSAEKIKFTIENTGIPYLTLKAYTPESPSQGDIVMAEDGDNINAYCSLSPGHTANIAVSFHIGENNLSVSDGTFGTLSVIAEAE